MKSPIPKIEVTITDPMILRLLGCVFYGNPFENAKEWSYENEIGHLWTRFMNLSRKYQYLLEKINTMPNIGFELHFEPEEYLTTKKYYVFVGIAIENLTDIPLELFYKPLPNTSYLSFSTKADNQSTAESVFRDWLLKPNSEYVQKYPYVIQRYDSKRYRGLEDPDSEIDWLIPVQKRTLGSENPA